MNMPNQNLLPKELVEIAVSLEKQFQKLNVPSRKIELAEWHCLSEESRKMIPNWLVTLLADYSLFGQALKLGKEFSKDGEAFCFWSPSIYSNGFTDYTYIEEILKPGFIPLSDTLDGTGNLWLTKITDNPFSPIYLFDLSGSEIKLIGGNLIELLKSSEGKIWENY
jgi:hypothetical protein